MNKQKTTNYCPFCACHSTHILGPTTSPSTSTHAKGYQIECINCGARGPSGMATPKDAVTVWDNGDCCYKRPIVTDKDFSEAYNNSRSKIEKVI